MKREWVSERLKDLYWIIGIGVLAVLVYISRETGLLEVMNESKIGWLLFFVTIFYTIIWIVIIRISYQIGKRKGRPGLGIFLCLVFGVLGLFITYIVPEKDQHR